MGAYPFRAMQGGGDTDCVLVLCLRRKRKPDRKPDCVEQETPIGRGDPPPLAMCNAVLDYS